MRQNNLEFISDSDFNALWAAMDVDNNGEVNAIDFFVFLSACGSQFEEVFHEQQGLTKKERLDAAARRLSKINHTTSEVSGGTNRKRVADISITPSAGNSTVEDGE